MGNKGKTLIFTSGTAVFGVFNGGDETDVVYREDTELPLAESVFAPASAQVHPLVVEGLGGSMAARVETEKLVLAAPGVRGIVVRPGLVYGYGGSYDLPALVKLARDNARGAHWGAGATVQGYVHLDDLAELFCLAVENAPPGTVVHGVSGEVSQRELAAAAGRMIGAGDRTDSFTMDRMFGPDDARVATGISLCLNKRLSSERTRKLLGWSPTRHDILEDLEFGSYASDPTVHTE